MRGCDFRVLQIFEKLVVQGGETERSVTDHEILPVNLDVMTTDPFPVQQRLSRNRRNGVGQWHGLTVFQSACCRWLAAMMALTSGFCPSVSAMTEIQFTALNSRKALFPEGVGKFRHAAVPEFWIFMDFSDDDRKPREDRRVCIQDFPLRSLAIHLQKLEVSLDSVQPFAERQNLYVEVFSRRTRRSSVQAAPRMRQGINPHIGSPRGSPNRISEYSHLPHRSQIELAKAVRISFGLKTKCFGNIALLRQPRSERPNMRSHIYESN
jgi:hypothetical protein